MPVVADGLPPDRSSPAVFPQPPPARDDGTHGASSRNVTAIGFLVIGYVVALAVLTRLRPVLAERRLWWFVALEAAMAGIVVGWLLHGRPPAALFNGAALAGFAVAWVISGRRARQKARGPTRRG